MLLRYGILGTLRRNFFRLRIRNLILILICLILLYTIKSFGELDTNVNPPPIENIPYIEKGPEMALNGIEDVDHAFEPKSMKVIDWHNYTQIIEESARVGLGEQGAPAYLEEKFKALEESLYAVNGFNGALSDRIPLNRSLPDIRHPLCKKRKYLADLPTVSVVVPFHNEHWSTLLRTAYSVLHRSPDHLIKEIFLVDDASTKEFLKDKLDEYLAENMPKVKVLRLQNRSGLITARLQGAKMATGDVLIFLDSHSEANVNWLPPLLDPIALDYRTVVCPFIDVVAYDTFMYRAQDEGARGAFDWEFFYKRLPVLPKDRAHMPDPFESPVMAGGLFAISRKWFWELGGYDPGLDIWGGEQYELSFKIWQCGGRMVDAPCSRVGHIYRKFAPFPNPGHGDFVGKNYRRVAEVWMDEYKKYLYDRRPHYLNIDPGDLSAQRAIREKLNCKPFEWFMKKVAFDLVKKYPVIEPKPYGHGPIKSHTGDYCIDGRGLEDGGDVTIRKCYDAQETNWLYTWRKEIRLDNRNLCLDVPDARAMKNVKVFHCHLGGGNQLFKYNLITKQIQHSSGTCLDWSPTKENLFVRECHRDDSAHPDPSPHSQQWHFGYMDEEAYIKGIQEVVDFDDVELS